MATKPKLIVILGPTASGKSELAVRIAKRFGGEIISADSRQVYRGMNIGAGKITKKEMRGVPHHLLDVASPKRKFTVAQYKELALKVVKKSLNAGKIPIICGGTGFYIQAVADGLRLPEVPPDWKLRKKLEKKTPEELFEILKKLDSRRAKTIDRYNPRRLIRAIEIVKKTGEPVQKIQFKKPIFDVLTLGIKKSPEELKRRIKKRLLKRLKQGMMTEVKRLKKDGLSWKRLEEFGLEYRWVAKFLQKKITRGKMIEKLQKEIEHYTKRQMTWFKRNSQIHWIKNYKEAKKLTRIFLKQ